MNKYMKYDIILYTDGNNDPISASAKNKRFWQINKYIFIKINLTINILDKIKNVSLLNFSGYNTTKYNKLETNS